MRGIVVMMGDNWDKQPLCLLNQLHAPELGLCHGSFPSAVPAWRCVFVYTQSKAVSMAEEAA